MKQSSVHLPAVYTLQNSPLRYPVSKLFPESIAIITQSGSLGKSTCPRNRTTQRRSELFYQAHDLMRLNRYSQSTDSRHGYWAKRAVVYHDKQYPTEMPKREVSASLACPAVGLHVAVSTQKQAVSRGTACRAPTVSALLPLARVAVRASALHLRPR